MYQPDLRPIERQLVREGMAAARRNAISAVAAKAKKKRAIFTKKNKVR
eukprot:SAG22_NODE_1612_length_3998_cov_12.441652_8_plen_48_part_00